jgi:hypothetical protein
MHARVRRPRTIPWSLAAQAYFLIEARSTAVSSRHRSLSLSLSLFNIRFNIRCTYNYHRFTPIYIHCRWPNAICTRALRRCTISGSRGTPRRQSQRGRQRTSHCGTLVRLVVHTARNNPLKGALGLRHTIRQGAESPRDRPRISQARRRPSEAGHSLSQGLREVLQSAPSAGRRR